MPGTDETTSALVVGAGPAGLAAAEVLASGGARVTVVDHRRNPGRKFLLAGRSGLNITNDEPLESLLDRYTPSQGPLRAAIEQFGPADVRSWCRDLGHETFVGSTGQVFPEGMRAAPLLRSWLGRLDRLGVTLLGGITFGGFDADGVSVEGDSADGIKSPAVVVLALGGASWPHVSSDGSWQAAMRAAGIAVDDFAPSNCGVRIAWSEHHRTRHEGTPLKNVEVSAGDRSSRGDVMITAHGLEGRPIYNVVPELRSGHTLRVDLAPDLTNPALTERLARVRRPKETQSSWLRRAGLDPARISLLRDATANQLPTDIAAVATLIKAVPLATAGLADLDRAISTAGGVVMSEIDHRFMLRSRPGTFVAGEMLAWDAPTGGYLLQGCLSSGRAAGLGALAWSAEQRGVGA